MAVIYMVLLFIYITGKQYGTRAFSVVWLYGCEVMGRGSAIAFVSKKDRPVIFLS